MLAVPDCLWDTLREPYHIMLPVETTSVSEVDLFLDLVTDQSPIWSPNSIPKTVFPWL